MDQKIETQLLECMICGTPVECADPFPEDEAVLCPLHFFTEDMSEEWESDEEED